jgi:3-hydroxyacyl-[acyl-carrier-protein] dehydratase
MLDNKQIQEIIPHRYPFLLVDKILEIEAGKKAIGLKNISINEPFFQGHFPQKPIMPGVLIIEALAQVGAVAILSEERYKGQLVLFAGIDKARFRRQVFPGDQLILEVELKNLREKAGKGIGIATVDKERAVEAELFFLLESKKE